MKCEKFSGSNSNMSFHLSRNNEMASLSIELHNLDMSNWIFLLMYTCVYIMCKLHTIAFCDIGWLIKYSTCLVFKYLRWVFSKGIQCIYVHVTIRLVLLVVSHYTLSFITSQLVYKIWKHFSYNFNSSLFFKTLWQLFCYTFLSCTNLPKELVGWFIVV